MTAGRMCKLVGRLLPISKYVFGKIEAHHGFRHFLLFIVTLLLEIRCLG